MSAKDQIKQIVDYFKRENFLKDKTDGMAEGLMLGASLADEANERSKEAVDTTLAVQDKYKEQILVHDLDPNKDPELVDLRNGNITAGERINKFEQQTEKQLSQIVIDVRGKYGAIGDGVADDTQAIKNAILDMEDNSILYFRNGIYKYTDDIFVKELLNITIRGDGAGATRILNESSGKTFAIEDCSYVDIESIGFIGNGKAPTGLNATGGDGLSFSNTSHVMVNGVDVSFNGGNGINLVRDCWVYNFNNVRLIGNLKNGIEALTRATLHSTAIYFSNSVIWLNKLAGIHWSGVSLSVLNSVIEQNQRGIWLDCTGSISPATAVTITGTDFEINEFEQIKITPDGEISGLAIVIDGNNFVNTEENVGKSSAMIVIDNTGNKVIGFDLRVNNYAKTDIHNVLDANNNIYADGSIIVNKLVPLSKYKNLGEAKIRGLSNSRVINGLLEQKGLPYVEPGSSNNLMSIDKPTGYWNIPVNEYGFIKSIDMNFYTDATSTYSVIFELFRHTPSGGAVEFAAANVTKTGGGGGKITFNVGLGLDISMHDSLFLKTTITKPASASIFAVTNLIVNGSF